MKKTKKVPMMENIGENSLKSVMIKIEKGSNSRPARPVSQSSRRRKGKSLYMASQIIPRMIVVIISKYI